ncbi:MAG: hypothetical protein EBZ34_03040 [Flavobacteriia bacterium]|nr:hypothetical protein [Flavobacteriia bacterium]
MPRHARCGALIWGNIRALVLASFIWVAICALAYFVDSEVQFYLLGAAVGLVLGGIQSLARSTFSKLLPAEGEHVTYFAFFDIAEKLATVFGMVAVGWLETSTGDLRLAAAMLSNKPLGDPLIMPPSGPLSTCSLTKLDAWVAAGALEN